MKLNYIVLFLILPLHLFVLSNIQFTAWPEMLSYPYLFSNGFTLYKDYIHPYPPLLTSVLSLVYSVFGFKIEVLQAFTWIYILLSDLVFFLIIKKIVRNPTTHYPLLITYIIVQSFLDGNMMWFDNALTLPVLGGFYFILKWLEMKREKFLFYASLAFTLAVLIKQTAVIYYLVYALFVVTLSQHLDRVKKIFLIPVLFGGIFLVYLLSMGIFTDFWNWVIYYPITFWSKYPGYKDLSLDAGEIKILVYLFSPLVFGVFAFRNLIRQKRFIVLVSLFAASIIAVYPRFTFFHLQPTIALLFAVFAYVFSVLQSRPKLIFLSAVILGSLLAANSVLPWRWGSTIRFYEKEDRSLIKMVNILSHKDEKVFLLGLPPQIYVLADRLPPKPWADNFGWYYEIPGFQEKVVAAFEETPPEKIFIGPTDYRPAKLVSYINSNYYLEGEPIEEYEIWKRK